MSYRQLCSVFLLFCLLFLIVGWPGGAQRPSSVRACDDVFARQGVTRRVNAPYFQGQVRFPETTILWFGQITPTENSVDARVGYNDDHVYLRIAAFDRRLWYDTSPSPQNLTA